MEINAYQMTGDILVIHRHPADLVGFHRMEWHGKAELVLLGNNQGNAGMNSNGKYEGEEHECAELLRCNNSAHKL
jgi:hypothetical protein